MQTNGVGPFSSDTITTQVFSVFKINGTPSNSFDKHNPLKTSENWRSFNAGLYSGGNTTGPTTTAHLPNPQYADHTSFFRVFRN